MEPTPITSKATRSGASVLRPSGRLIQEARLRKGLSVAELAKLADVSKWTIYEIEKGNRLPRITNLAQIAKALGVKIDTLLERHYTAA